MANLRSSRLSTSGLGTGRATAVPPARRKLMMAAAVLAGAILLALAWFDGGEKALRPIAEPVTLPGQMQ